MRIVTMQGNHILKMLQRMGRAWSTRTGQQRTIATVPIDWEAPHHHAEAIAQRQRTLVTAATYQSRLV